MSQSNDNDRPQQQREALLAVKDAPLGSRMKVWTRLCGPGWLQSAITLGGGTLASSLYLGVLAGYQFLWLQPLMMILGIVMLGAIAYVTLSTGERPLDAINKHVNPVLGYGWVGATIIANLVWAMPQFSLTVSSLKKNFALEDHISSAGLVGIVFVVCVLITILYDRGGMGMRVFERILKAMVALIILSFFAVVLVLAFGNPGLPWGRILAGFVPDFGLFNHVAQDFVPHVEASATPEYWRTVILAAQRDNLIAAGATAVGINMTFFLPYSMLRKKWDREFRELAIFDLSTGLFIPFMLVVSCVVIASASQFHARYDTALTGETPSAVAPTMPAEYKAQLEDCLQTRRVNLDEQKALLALPPLPENADAGQKAGHADATRMRYEAWLTERVPLADKRLAAMLIKRNAGELATTIERLTGPVIAQKIFGLGVVGMTISSIIMLMLINGFAFQEAFKLPKGGTGYRVATMLPGISGALGALYLWGTEQANFWLAIPTSVFAMILLPLAYITFFFMMNSRRLMGDNMPRGGARVVWNVLMLVAITVALAGSIWSVHRKVGVWGFVAQGVFILAAVVVGLVRKAPASAPPARGGA